MVERTTTGGTGAGRGEATRNRPVYTPAADIYETEDALVLLVEMPGVRPDQVEVGLDKRVLTITGHAAMQRHEGFSLALCEFRPGDFERVFTLSDMIDEGGIEAAMRDGVLRLTLPKAKAEPAKTIKVKVG